MNRELHALINAPIGNELGVCPGVGLQLGQDIPVAFPGENKSPFRVWKPSRLIGERGQFIGQGQPADAGADIVEGTEQVSQVGNGRHTGAAPGIGSPAACNSG